MKESTVSMVISSADALLRECLQLSLRRWACSSCVRIRLESPAERMQDGTGHRLLFLDMDDMNAPEQMGQSLNNRSIIISRDHQQAIAAYQWHPAAFLQPDFTYDQLVNALMACREVWRPGLVYLESPEKRSTVRLPLGRILYIEARQHYCLVYTDGGNRAPTSVRMRFSMNELEAILPKPPFIRCHRSYFVHIAAVEKMSYTGLRLCGGSVLIPVGRTYYTALVQAVAN